MSLYSSGKARRSIIDTVAFRALSQLATMIGLVVLVRAMPKEDFGVFNLLYAFIPVVSTVASLGLEQVLKRYQPEYLRGGNLAGAAWLFRFVASTRFICNVCVLGLVLLTWNYIAPLFKLTDYRLAFAAFSLLVLLNFQGRILQIALASHMLHRFSTGSVAVMSISKLIVYLVLLWFGELTLMNAIAADTIGYALAYVVLRYAYNKHAARDVSVKDYKPEPDDRRRMVRYGMFNNFNDAGVMLLNSNADNFFIAAFIDPISVGIYSFYTRLQQMIANLLPLRLFDTVVQPMLFSMKREDAERRLPQIFSFLLNINLLVQVPIFAFSCAYHAEIVNVVFGGKFIEHSWMLPVILGFATLNVIADPVSLTAHYEEKAGIILLSKLTAIYNVAALLVLVPRMGVLGAAIASGSAQACKNCFIWWHVRDRAVWGNAAQFLVSAAAVWGTAVLICYALKRWVPAHDIVQLAMGVCIFGCAALVYIRTPALSTSDRATLGTVLRGREVGILQRLGLLTAPSKAG